MRQRLGKWLGVPASLVDNTSYLAAAAFCFIAAQTMTKAVRDGVFLTRFGLAGLSYAMLGMALVATLVAAAYHHFTGVVNRRHAIVWLQLAIAASMVAIGEALHRAVPGAPVVLYVWSGIVGLVALAELWLLADELFDAQVAKRAFAVIGVGAIVGGIAGGLSTRLLAAHLSARGMLWVVAGELVAAAALMRVAMLGRDHRERVTEPAPRYTDSLRALRDSSYVRTLVVIVFCLTVGVTTIEWQMKGYAKAHFVSDQQQMVAFFGLLGAVVSALSLVLQLIGTERILRRFGAVRTLRGLPAVVGAASAGLLASVAFPAAAIALCAVGAIASGTLRLSADKAAFELLYLPLPARRRAAAKRFIDTAVDRAGGAVTAALWLVLVSIWHVDRPERVAYASFVGLGAAVVWLWAVARMRRQYVEAQRLVIGVAVTPPPPLSARTRRQIIVLWSHLDREARIRTRVLRRLNALQAGAPLELAWSEIEAHIAREAQDARVLAQVHTGELGKLGSAGRTLCRLVETQLTHALERTARLLALVYPPRDLDAMQEALRVRSSRVRGAAVELLDSMLHGREHRELVRVVAELTSALPSSTPPLTVEASLALLLEVEHPQLRACAAWVASRAHLHLEKVAAIARTDGSPFVRTVARVSQRRRSVSARPSRGVGSHEGGRV